MYIYIFIYIYIYIYIYMNMLYLEIFLYWNCIKELFLFKEFPKCKSFSEFYIKNSSMQNFL